jgi:hypothetical protein
MGAATVGRTFLDQGVEIGIEIGVGMVVVEGAGTMT